MSWEIDKLREINRDSILLVGLPGIGNVAKIVVDFLVEELQTEKVMDFFSYRMPHSVFVTENNMVELPKIELFYAEKKNLLILTGDTQPIDEIGTYDLCETLLDYFQENHGKEILTFGGIGLSNVPKSPKVYITGNDQDIIKKYVKDTKMNEQVYGVVGPIIGVAGLLLGLADRRNIPAASILAQTLGHPMYLGLKGSREILKVLDRHFEFGVDLKKLEEEIDELETKMKISEDLGKISKKKGGEMSYIG
jgi:uncharacterized protein (TIGR00162 family)